MGRDVERSEWIIFKQLMHLNKDSDNVHTISYLNETKLDNCNIQACFYTRFHSDCTGNKWL